MTTPENTFIASVHRHLPPTDEFHREKMSNPYTSGTADVWYSGKHDLWIEYKFVTVPKRDGTIIDLTAGKKPMLSVLQQRWLNGRLDEGRNVWVIVGCAQGGVVFTKRGWEQAHSAATYRRLMFDRKALAALILDFARSD